MPDQPNGQQDDAGHGGELPVPPGRLRAGEGDQRTVTFGGVRAEYVLHSPPAIEHSCASFEDAHIQSFVQGFTIRLNDCGSAVVNEEKLGVANPYH